MDSLEEKLSSILSDADAVSKLKSLGAALGLDTSENSVPLQKPKSQQPFNLPFANSGSGADTGTQDELMSTLMRLVPLMSDMNKEDEVSRLLGALRPFLSEKRRSRLDDAGKMLRVMRLLPVIRSTGLL